MFAYKVAPYFILIVIDIIMHQSFVSPGPVIAGLKCQDFTADESRQCHRCAGALISR